MGHRGLMFIFGFIFGFFLLNSAALLSQDEQNYCATYNNDLRRNVATGNQPNRNGMLPPATNMLQMFYNTTTGQTAQTWANQCKFVHSNEPGGLGENIYYSTAEGMSNTEALNKAFGYWWNESITVGIPENLVVDQSNFGPIGHFTQMAWHSTTDIGCGVASCQNEEWKTFVVCNYWPPGNYVGETVYGAGATCSACDPGWSCDKGRRGLCVRNGKK
uniref:Putative effector protein n=1 Tax=Heterodera avenae TaxID=34510 RepID=A0A2L0VDN1_HETAV|nr:putative effector protein [Heterodera avenae]AZL96421.1 venom allergen-like protein 2 [Heterodera avenae]